MSEKMPGSIYVLRESAEKDLVQWAPVTQKKVIPVVGEMIIHKASEIQRYMFGSIRSVGLVGQGWCDRFMGRHGKLTLRTAQVIKQARNEAILEVLQSFFHDTCKNIIEQTTKITVVEYGREWLHSEAKLTQGSFIKRL